MKNIFVITIVILICTLFSACDKKQDTNTVLRTDIYEKEGTLYMVCDMPGVDENVIEISLENDVLTLKGSQKNEVPEGCELIYQEYETGIYERSFTLSDEIDREKIKAKINNGVLKLELHKAEKAKPKKIEIKVER